MKDRIEPGDLVCWRAGLRRPVSSASLDLLLVIDVVESIPQRDIQLLAWESLSTGERGQTWEDWLVLAEKGS